MEIKLQPMDEKTVLEVCELEKECFTDPWESICGELSNDMAFWIVAIDTDTDRVVGYGGIHILLDEGNIMNIAVKPSYRRNQIGEKIVNSLLNYATCAECVFLEVRAANKAAIALYEKAGFEQISVRKGYYNNPSEDALIMRKLI